MLLPKEGKRFINKTHKTIQYLLKYKSCSIYIIFFIIIGTMLEGFSAGMVIPIIQQIISPGASIIADIPVLNSINLVININHNQTKEILFILLTFTFSLILFKNIFIFAGKRFIWRLRFLLYSDLQNELFDRLIAGGIIFFDAAKSGHIMHSFNRETERIAAYIFNFLSLITISIQILVYSAVLALISWKLSIVCISLIALIFPVVHFIRKRKEIFSTLSNKSHTDANFVLMEFLTGIRTIKLFVAERVMKGHFQHEMNNAIDKEYKANVSQELLTPVFEIFIVGAISMGFIMTISIKDDIAIFLPQVIAFMWILLRALNQLNSFNHFRTEMAGCIGAFDSYEGLLRQIADSIQTNGHIKIEHFLDKIEFKNATFCYSQDKEILKNISFIIHKGKITAIVGSSGVGKSTIVNLIPRLYDVTSGEIIIDGINLKCLDIYSWRSRIGFVSQDVFIFNATVRANIAFGLKDVSEEKIITAAKIANIHDFIMMLPDRYNTILGERGIKLSGGQKQRISIARAVIREPEILILDEATSALDTESERLVQEAIDRICRNQTVIVIAHRLSTVQNADHLLVIENGQIVEQGTHEELLVSNGRYSQLYSIQYSKAIR